MLSALVIKESFPYTLTTTFLVLRKKSISYVKSIATADNEHDAEPVIMKIDEIIDYSEQKHKVLPASISQRVSLILTALQNKTILASDPLEIGDLIASLAELIPIVSEKFVEFCDTVAKSCKDNTFVQLSDEAIETVTTILLNHLDQKPNDPCPGLSAISTILYSNSSRLFEFHSHILDTAISFSSKNDETTRRISILLGNLTSFAEKKAELPIYTKSVKYLVQSLKSSNINVLISSLHALKMLIDGAPQGFLDPPALVRTFSSFLFREKASTNLKFEALSAMKSLVENAKTALCAQWPFLLTKSPSLFDLIKPNQQKIAKTCADLICDIFRDTWSYLKIASNVERKTSFTTLAQDLGEIVNVCFNRFMLILDRSIPESQRIEAPVFNRVALAFATFLRNVNFGGGRLKGDYIDRVVSWGQSSLHGYPEETLIIYKAFLWTPIDYPPFAHHFDTLFSAFLLFITNQNPNLLKPAKFALCRLAYAYPQELVKRWDQLCPKLHEVGPHNALPILLRLAENKVEDMAIWQEVLEYHVRIAFETPSDKESIKRSLLIIGYSGQVFDKLSDNLQRFCLSTVIGSDLVESARAVGLLAQSPASTLSPVFLVDALRKLTESSPDAPLSTYSVVKRKNSEEDISYVMQALSYVLEAFAVNRRDDFDPEWLPQVINAIESVSSKYQPRCIGFLFAFINDAEIATRVNKMLLDAFESEDGKVRWNAAASLATAFSFDAVSSVAVEKLIDALENDRIAKVRIKSAMALASIKGRSHYGDKFHSLLIFTLKELQVPSHFDNLSVAVHRKYDQAYRENLKLLFFKLVSETKARDFAAVEAPLVESVDFVFNMMCEEENPPWEAITRLYEAKFSAIPSEKLIRFQEMAFPVD